MYGYDKDEFTDAYDAFVGMYRACQWNWGTPEHFAEFLKWLPEADHTLIDACTREYIQEFLTF